MVYMTIIGRHGSGGIECMRAWGEGGGGEGARGGGAGRSSNSVPFNL